MSTLHASRRRSVLLACAVGALAGCGNSSDPASPSPLAGSYTATAFRVTLAGQNAIDVLAQGGALSVTVAADDRTSGTLVVPSSVTGTAAVTQSMAGTAVRNGTTVRFQLSTDSFMRDLVFTTVGTVLQASNQTVAGTTFTVVLTRQ